MEHEEALKILALLNFFSDSVEKILDVLLADGVVTSLEYADVNVIYGKTCIFEQIWVCSSWGYLLLFDF